MFKLNPRSPYWWTWTATAILLIAGLAGMANAMTAAVAVSVAQAVFMALRERSLLSFPAQLRAAYLIWMLLGFVPVLFWMHWIQAIGTTALILFGYCPLARMLLFLPWNRTVPLSFRRVLTIIFHPPVVGSVQTGLPL